MQFLKHPLKEISKESYDTSLKTMVARQTVPVKDSEVALAWGFSAKKKPCTIIFDL